MGMVKLLNANDLLAEVVKAQALEPDKAVAKIIMYITEAEGVEVVHGRWIRKPIGKYTGVDEVCCSICGCFLGVVASDTAFREAIEGMNYCPNCGADMRERKNNENDKN